jgi:ABC-type phosphate transport system substrate-binding protein
MNGRPPLGWCRLAALLAAAAAMIGAVTVVAPGPVGADSDPSTLSGQGGSFLQPVVSKLLLDDSSNLSPLFGAYTATDINSGIASFVGTGVGQFGADYAVSERPLTSAEAATATADGRSFAYVPFAETPVAIATLVPNNAWPGTGSIANSDFCQHIPLTTDLLGQIFGFNAQSPLKYWNDPRIDCPPGGAGNGEQIPIVLWANLDPSMANSALMSLLDSTPSSKAYFDAGLSDPGSASLTTDDTPSELWPYGQHTIPGGDQPLIGKLLAISAQTNTPSQNAATWALGATAPISSVWTDAPLGVPWNLMTAAVENADNQFVVPSTAAAQAAAADATVASTSDPTTNNLVTFNASTTDASAYNNYLMEESYLVVPTTSLSAAKAQALAQFVRYVLGSKGQADIEDFGAAPATSAMVTAGLKVAVQLDAEGAATAAQSSITGSTSTTTTTTAAAASSAGAPTASAGSTGSGADGTGGTDSSGLAFTGAPDLTALLATGGAFIAIGILVRRRLRHREVR